MSDRISLRWSFVRHLDKGEATWLWQRFGPDGRIEKTSQSYATYGKVLMAALENGFRPGLDDYSVDLPHGRMHFPQGRAPEFSAALSPLSEFDTGRRRGYRKGQRTWTEVKR
jgi:hypothetical protein